MEVKNQDTFEFVVLSRPGLEKVAIDTAASVAEMMGFSEDCIEDLKTAVEEVAALWPVPADVERRASGIRCMRALVRYGNVSSI